MKRLTKRLALAGQLAISILVFGSAQADVVIRAPEARAVFQTPNSRYTSPTASSGIFATAARSHLSAPARGSMGSSRRCSRRWTASPSGGVRHVFRTR